MEEASASTSAENVSESITEVEKNIDNQKRNDLTNALIYCKSLLEAENLLTNTPSTEISAASIAMGEEIFKEIIFMLEDRQIVTDECLISAEEFNIDNEEKFEEVCFNFFTNTFSICFWKQ